MRTMIIKKLYQETDYYVGKEISITGWIRTIRDSKHFGFIELNDGSFFKSIQIVFDDTLPNYKEIAKLPISSTITVIGNLALTSNCKQPFEIKALNIKIEGLSSKDFPLQKKKHSFEYLRTISHLRPRSNAFSAVFRIRSLASYAVHKFFNEQNFVYVHTPLITGNDCEGAGDMFKVTTLDMNNIPRTESGDIDYSKDFFSKSTNLTVSGQLSAEAFALAFGDVYTFGPTFRAENSYTSRHAAEFWMIEPEMAFANLTDVMDISENMIKFVIKYVLENAPEEMEFFNKFIDNTLFDRLNNVLDSRFGRITYTDAIEILEKANEEFTYKIEWGVDLQTEHERYLAEKVFKKPVYVVDYPKGVKPFYARINHDDKTVSATDLLVPGVGEIISGSEREERLDILINTINDLGLDEKEYWWYLDLRKYGATKHAGFGLGFERILMYITGMSNIRDVIPFPRTTGSAEF